MSATAFRALRGHAAAVATAGGNGRRPLFVPPNHRAAASAPPGPHSGLLSLRDGIGRRQRRRHLSSLESPPPGLRNLEIRPGKSPPVFVDAEGKVVAGRRPSKHRKERGRSRYKFVDRCRIRVAGGEGGRGTVSYVAAGGRGQKKRPDGGHGGNGGSVILVATPGESSLGMDRHHYRGEGGGGGGPRGRGGRGGRDVVIRVPCGVVVRRVLEYGEVWDEATGTVRLIDREGGGGRVALR